MVTIRVGDNEAIKNFTLYKSIICQSSDFVNNALKVPWRESDDGVIKLPTISAMYFKIYHSWLLSGKLYSKPSAKLISTAHDQFENETPASRT